MYNYTYGEITYDGIKNLYPTKIKSANIIDLGCGKGKSLIYFKSLYPKSKVSGVEIYDDYYNKAKKTTQSIDVNLMHDDLFNIDLSPYNVIYISNLCFPEEINNKIGEKIINECVKSPLYIGCSTGLNISSNSKYHVNREKKSIKQTWSDTGNGHLYVLEKTDKSKDKSKLKTNKVKKSKTAKK